MFAHRCRIIGRQWRQQCTIHLQYTFNVRCQNWQNRPFSRVFLPYFRKKHPFSCFGSILPPFSRIRAYTRSSRKNTPFIRVFLFTHGYQSRTRVAPPPPPRALLPPCDNSMTTLVPPCDNSMTTLLPPCDYSMTTLLSLCNKSMATLSAPCENSMTTLLTPCDIFMTTLLPFFNNSMMTTSKQLWLICHNYIPANRIQLSSHY